MSGNCVITYVINNNNKVMTTNKQIDFLIRRYKAKYQNKKSKWFGQDVQDYSDNLVVQTSVRITELYNQALAFDSLEFEAEVEAEEKKMDKGGMYDMGNMKPENALD